MTDDVTDLHEIAIETSFSGVVRVDVDGATVVDKAYGLAHRALALPCEVGSQFAIASGTKGFTALAVVSLIDAGLLAPATTARSILGSDLPLIDDGVTIEHLLAHRSGIGDYLDEDAAGDINDYVLPVPVHDLVTTEDFLRVLDGQPTKFAPGERFSYCNGGYVVLALIAERAAGVPYHDLVDQRVCQPAGLDDTSFLRSDELPGRAALGYLEPEGLRTNAFHLPIRGSGDGGIYSTAADIHRLWASLFAGEIVSPDWVAAMIRPRSEAPALSMRYGLGFWLDEAGDGVHLEGYDAGVSFRSRHDPTNRVTWTVVSNTSTGAWPIARRLKELGPR